MALITKTEYETLTNSSLSAYPDNYVTAVLQVVSDHAEGWCDKKFTPTAVTDEMADDSFVDKGGWLHVRAQCRPIISVSGLKFQYAGAQSEIDISAADINYKTGIIRLVWYKPLFGGPDKWLTLLSYTHGFAAVPDRAKMGTALLVREAIEADEQAAREGLAYPLESYRVGSYSETYAIRRIEAGSDLGLGTELSIRARSYFIHYRDPGVA